MKNSLWFCLLCMVANTAWSLPPELRTDDFQSMAVSRTIGISSAQPVLLPHPARDDSATLKALLAKPLDADAAVRIALLNNPGLQATLGHEGRYLSTLFPTGTVQQQAVAQQVTVLSALAVKAWTNAVSTEQAAALERAAMETAQTSDALKRRMVLAGNSSKLAQAQTQALLSQAAVAVARAELAAHSAREQLTRVLGVWGSDLTFTLAKALPALPPQPLEIPDIEAQVLAALSDVRYAAAQWEIQRKRELITSPQQVWEAWADAAKQRAGSVTLRSQAREAYLRYRTTLDIARHLQDEVVPVRQFIHDELVLRYNGMLTSVFDVLTDSQSLTMARRDALMAQRDFWLAEADLQAMRKGAPLELLGVNPDAGGNGGAAAAPAGH